MRNVKRSKTPKSLARNAERWTNELRAARESNDRERVRKAQNKYKKKDVREALEKMYRGLCCYCEGNISEVSFGHIEHLRPISAYPESAFDWRNLHLACEKCNVSKSDQYDEQHPIVDPTDDESVRAHLSYRLSAEKAGVTIRARTSRGETTRLHADLDRDELCEGRGEVLSRAWELFDKLEQRGDAPINAVVSREVEKLKKGRFGSVVELAPQWMGQP